MISLSLTGFTLMLTGTLYRVPKIAAWDARVFQFLHPRLRKNNRVFCYLWPLGTTPVAVALICMSFLAGQRAGWHTALVYAGAAAIERIIKMGLKRARPFRILDNVRMAQPTPPRDPSHPSGDAMRVWFLALVIPAIFSLSWPASLATCLTAAALSLGRIALGAHYPLDVIGGSGLGLLAASITVSSLQSSIFGL